VLPFFSVCFEEPLGCAFFSYIDDYLFTAPRTIPFVGGSAFVFVNPRIDIAAFEMYTQKLPLFSGSFIHTATLFPETKFPPLQFSIYGRYELLSDFSASCVVHKKR